MQRRIHSDEHGFGLITMIIGLGVMVLLGYFVITRIVGNGADDPAEAAGELIDDAQDTVNKANDARKKAEDIIDIVE